jgi:hypothetical protein
MALNDRKVSQVKPKAKDYKLSDEKGMYLLIKVNGSKYWRLKYRYSGREKTLSLGIYPDVSLKEARLRRDEARKLLANGEDPSQVKQEIVRAKKIRATNGFEAIAREWWENQKGNWTERHANRVLRTLKADVFPYIGNKPIAEIQPPEVLAVIRRVEARGALNVAGRLLQRCSTVFRYAVQTGRSNVNPAGDLQGTLKIRKVKHQPSLPRTELPKFLQGIIVCRQNLLD